MPYQRRTVDPKGRLKIPEGPIDQDVLEDDEEEIYTDEDFDPEEDYEEELKRKARLKSRPGPMDISGFRFNPKRKKY